MIEILNGPMWPVAIFAIGALFAGGGWAGLVIGSHLFGALTVTITRTQDRRDD